MVTVRTVPAVEAGIQIVFSRMGILGVASVKYCFDIARNYIPWTIFGVFDVLSKAGFLGAAAVRCLASLRAIRQTMERLWDRWLWIKFRMENEGSQLLLRMQSDRILSSKRGDYSVWCHSKTKCPVLQQGPWDFFLSEREAPGESRMCSNGETLAFWHPLLWSWLACWTSSGKQWSWRKYRPPAADDSIRVKL